jgi:UDPglucose 6-dehydrogenase
VSKFLGIFQDQHQLSLLKAVLEENEVQKELLFRKLWQHYQGELEGKVVALWGASFKPGTPSIENAPSLKIIDALIAQGVKVNIHDPEALKNIQSHYGEEPLIKYHELAMSAVDGADGLLLVTEWPEYYSLDYKKLAKAMRQRLVIDGRNIFDKGKMDLHEFNYIGVGR